MASVENSLVEVPAAIGQPDYPRYQPGNDWGAGFTFDVPLAVILTLAWRELHAQRVQWAELSQDLKRTLTLLEQAVRQKG